MTNRSNQWSMALVILMFVGLAPNMSACTDEGVTLPSNYNTGRYRRVEIQPNEKVTGAASNVKALNGMHGSPLPVVPGDKNLKLQYWGRLAGSPEADGAHVNMVRIGTDVDCALSLESIFKDQKKSVEDPNSYDFSTLDKHVAAILGDYAPQSKSFSGGLNTAKVLWQAGLNVGPVTGCKADAEGHQQGSAFSAGGDYPLWASVAFNTLQHLKGVGKWSNTNAPYKIQYVEFMDDPLGRFPGGYTSNWTDLNWERLHTAYKDLANKIKEAWPDSVDDAGKRIPAVHIGGISFTFSEESELAYTNDQQKHGLLRFIDFCKANKVPLDFVSFKTKTRTAYKAAKISGAIRSYLNQNGYGDVQLIATSVKPDYTDPKLQGLPGLAYNDLKSAHLGAFQTAARIYFQDTPVDWMIAGRGPRVFSDLEAHSTINNFQGLLVESDYFYNDATAKPAYMALFPFRQVSGHQRVVISEGADSDGMTILASHDPNNSKVLHVIVANSNVSSGMASITYDLVLAQFAPPTVTEVEYKLAILDRGSYGVQSFHFSETGKLETGAQTGSIRFIHDMAVPSVHYIQFVQP
jgi:hypothetical protein